MKITFIGLGIMGSRMAANLLKNEVDLTVWNRSKEPVDQLVAQGAKTAATPQEAVAEADLVFTMLANPQVVDKIMLTKDAALAAMPKGAIWADSSTVNPSFSLKAAKASQELGLHFLDAPVAGTLPHAQNAQLTFFVGGAEAAVKKAKPFMEMMGQRVLHLGASSKGACFKMLVNAMLAQSMIIFSEAVLLGEKMGLPKDFLLQTIPGLPVIAPFTQAKAGMIEKDEYDVMFPLELMYKDLHLATTTAYEFDQPLYLANLSKELFASAKQAGMGRLDFAAIHRYLEQ